MRENSSKKFDPRTTAQDAATPDTPVRRIAERPTLVLVAVKKPAATPSTQSREAR